jgi:DNA-binding beta-propeller fold protein YncE
MQSPFQKKFITAPAASSVLGQRRWRPVPALVSVVVGLSLALLPASGADAARMIASPALSAGPANPATAYVVNKDSGTLTPIRTATNTAGTPIPVGISAYAIAITRHGKTAYVVAGGRVIPIQTATNTVGPPITAGSNPQAIAITPNGKTAYVLNIDSNTVTPIQTAPARQATRSP